MKLVILVNDDDEEEDDNPIQLCIHKYKIPDDEYKEISTNVLLI